MEEELKRSLQIVTRLLEEQSFRYAVIGGISLTQWGVARFTHDIDIKVLVPNVDYTSVRSVLQAA